jgi:hypothetical protein
MKLCARAFYYGAWKMINQKQMLATNIYIFIP